MGRPVNGLALRHLQLIRAAETRLGLKDGGMYRLPVPGAPPRWFKVWVVFYPKTRWLAQEYTAPYDSKPIGKHILLTLDISDKLESWL